MKLTSVWSSCSVREMSLETVLEKTLSFDASGAWHVEAVKK